MIDWQTIQDTLREWACRVTGLRTFWRNEATEHEDRPYCELSVGVSDSLGTDETLYEYDPGNGVLVTTQCGQRIFTLGIRVITRGQNPTGAARWYLEKARTALRKPSSREAFQLANLALIESMPILNLDRLFQDRMESVALLEVRFGTTAVEVDPGEQAGYIEKTEVTSVLKDPGGTPLPASLQWNRKEIP